MSRNAAGQFVKGASGNPSGVRKAKQAPGTNGVRSYGGWIATQERSRDLIGAQKWLTYSNAFAFPPVAIAALLRYALISGAKWSLVENPAGGKDAIRGMEIVQQGLLEADLESGDTWNEIAAKASMSYFNGSSIHAAAVGRRKDGMVVYTDIGHRPMHTIERWPRPGDRGPFTEAEQNIDGAVYRIPLGESLYVVERMLGDDPYGVGVLRLIVERLRRVDNYEKLEGYELFSSLGGLPIYRAPFEEIKESTSALDESAQEAEISRRVADIEGALANRIKMPDKQQYLGLDSKTYEGSDPNTISSNKKWDIEIVKGELQGLADVRKVVTDHHMDVARVLHIEFVYVGGGDSAGTFGMHESKLSSFAKQVQTSLNTIGRRAKTLVHRLIRANGLDPDTAAPLLVPEQIAMQSVLDTVSMLEGMQRAGLHAKDPARNILREQRGLPPEPDEVMEDMMAPRGDMPPEPEDDPTDVTEPDPDSEEDIDE